MLDIMPVDVKVQPYDGPADLPNAFTVSPVWPGVDRSDEGGGMVVNGRKLAGRLAACMRAGDAWTSARIATDVSGATYVQTSGSRVLARMANADLRRLGY